MKKKMAHKQNNSLPGLPPLPKSLTSNNSSPLNHNNHHAQVSQAFSSLEHELYMGASTSSRLNNAQQRQNHRHGSLSSTQESLSDRESVHSRASSSHSNHQTNLGQGELVAGTATLDTQLAILRREMYGLRQLDLSLLSQLWALNESIQGFRVFLQEQDALSPPSPSSPTPSDANSLTSGADDEDCFVSVTTAPTPTTTLMSNVPHAVANGSTTSHASSSASNSGASSATSSMGKNVATGMLPPKSGTAHPQLPRILQQRMRRAPPPPPPTLQQQQQALINKNLAARPV